MAVFVCVVKKGLSLSRVTTLIVSVAGGMKAVFIKTWLSLSRRILSVGCIVGTKEFD
jgi:hypothetical protein